VVLQLDVLAASESLVEAELVEHLPAHEARASIRRSAHRVAA
jgi:hypothetical protein